MRALLFVVMTMSMPSAQAYLTLNESTDVTPAGEFRIGLEPQIRTSNGSGGNLGMMLESGLNEEWSWRAGLGTGETDFWAQGSVKWVPIPDFERQPGIGIRGDIIVGREADASLTQFRLTPMMSKGFPTELGRVVPYGGIPLGFGRAGGENQSFSQLIIGSEFSVENHPDLLFAAELGFSLSKSFAYVSGLLVYRFDSITKAAGR